MFRQPDANLDGSGQVSLELRLDDRLGEVTISESMVGASDKSVALRLRQVADMLDPRPVAADADPRCEPQPRRLLPGRLTVGHQVYDVAYDQAAVDARGLKDRSPNGLAGYSDAVQERIALAVGLGFNYEAETLLHEVLHTCFRASGFEPDALARVDPENVEEGSVQALTGPLLRTLRDNPALIEYLLAR